MTLPHDHPLFGLTIDDGRLVHASDCPLCNGELHTLRLTPEQARQLATELLTLACEAAPELVVNRPVPEGTEHVLDHTDVIVWRPSPSKVLTPREAFDALVRRLRESNAEHAADKAALTVTYTQGREESTTTTTLRYRAPARTAGGSSR